MHGINRMAITYTTERDMYVRTIVLSSALLITYIMYCMVWIAM